MSAGENALKVNEYIDEAADAIDSAADKIRDLVNDGVQSPEFLMDAENAIANLRHKASEMRDETLDETSY